MRINGASEEIWFAMLCERLRICLSNCSFLSLSTILFRPLGTSCLERSVPHDHRRALPSSSSSAIPTDGDPRYSKRSILFYYKEKSQQSGKGTRTRITMPLASLHTYHIYKIFQYERTGYFKTRILLTRNSRLRSEMELWLEVQPKMSGAPW